MNKINGKVLTTILIFAFIGWGLCGAIMGIGMQVTSIENTLIIHAIGAPVFFAMLSLVYFKKFNYTTALQTATIFLAFVIFMDFLIVALLVQKNLEMFESILGTWLPFALIFMSTYLTGSILRSRKY